MKNKPIGIFDSGLGGLTVFKAIRKSLPLENLIYFGDTAHVPYGNKSPETVTKYSLAIAKFLAKKNIKLLVVACNSASSTALNALKKQIKIPIIDVIVPGGEQALNTTKNGRISVIGTKATVSSNAYVRKIKSLNAKSKVYQMPCPLFVPLAEEGLWNDKITLDIAKKYLTPLKNKNTDTVILACTHYPIIQHTIAKVMGKNVRLINSADAVAKKVKEVLKTKNLLNRAKNPKVVFYSSDSPKDFKIFAQKILKKPVKKVLLKNLNG